ncbi:DUF6933 domain-containing protein [Salinicoccus sp. HZC-1]|uniref:DUF6933 domain-containing protein n=1 Tax=Salinicoccus sp. HZC-1 TaxID=3385497 RepID=UPI00398AE3D8
MIINPTKKSLPLFNKLQQTEDKAKGKAFSEINPFFSWHANYINVERKKVLILVNDRTYLPLLITNVDVKRKKELESIIEDGIRTMFRLIGVKLSDIDRYIEMAGKIEINAAYDRKTLGHINDYLFLLSVIDMDLSIPYEQCLFLAKTPQGKLEEHSSIEETLAVFSRGIGIEEVGEQEPYQIERTWEPFSRWNEYVEKGSFEDFEEMSEEVRKNNDKLLYSFGRYLQESENQSRKTAEKHVFNAEFYLNSYLLHSEIRTVLTATTDPADFLGNWYTRKALWANEKNLKQSGTALRKLYKFLNEADEISDKELEESRPAITEGIEEGKDHLKAMESDSFY